jgi:CheY-like chemotaxis protein
VRVIDRMFLQKTVILLVDDEQNPLILRKMLLEKEGYEVVTASGATEALGIISTRRVDLVISDHLMPGTTGAELARQIKASWPNLSIILLSGVKDIPPDADAADLFLSKVEGPEVLREKISLLLAGGAAAKEQERAGFPESLS